MHFLPDTSALTKHYLREPRSPEVSILLSDVTNSVTVSQLLRTEFASALGRRRREGKMSQQELSEAWALFLAHQKARYRVAPLTAAVQVIAERLLFTHTLRAADAIHIASAIEVAAVARDSNGAFAFLTADRRQATAAEAEGLTVVYVGD